MDFEPCFKVSNLVSVHPKIAKLSQMFIDLNGLSISWKKKLALAPCAIPETPILIPSRAVARKNLWLRQCPWKTYDRGNRFMVELSS